MLRRNSSDNHFISRNGADAILKHKIRNLRAKLKTLLSSESCFKYSKRDKQVQKMQSLENNQFFSTKTFFNQSKHLFTHTKQQPKQFWYSSKNKCNAMNVFGGLSKQEIQQVKEDMIYYLGEENVEKFKDFLEVRAKKKKLAEKENQNCCDNFGRRLKTLKEQNNEATERFQSSRANTTQRKSSQLDTLPKFIKNCSINQTFTPSFRRSFENNPPIQSNNMVQASNKRLKTANLIQSRASTLTKRSTQKQRMKFQANYLGNRQNFMYKRRIIEQEENAQRLLTKINLQMKLEKAFDIFKITQQAFLSTIKQKNTQNDTKTKKILEDKYKKNVTFGSIVELNEELRKIYIKKISEGPVGSLDNSKVSQEQPNDRMKYETTLSNFFVSSTFNNSKY